MRKSIGYQAIRDKAIKFLKVRLHSAAELRRKLLIRGFSKALVEQLVKELTDLGYLNDEIFAESYLDSLIKYKSFGFFGLKAKLLSRGIDESLISSLLSRKLSEEQEIILAKKALERKGGTDRIKLMQALSRKGFRSQVIKRLLNV